MPLRAIDEILALNRCVDGRRAGRRVLLAATGRCTIGMQASDLLESAIGPVTLTEGGGIVGEAAALRVRTRGTRDVHTRDKCGRLGLGTVIAADTQLFPKDLKT